MVVNQGLNDLSKNMGAVNDISAKQELKVKRKQLLERRRALVNIQMKRRRRTQDKINPSERQIYVI